MNRPSWNLEPCGTTAAYRRHYRKGQKPCQRCRDATNLAKRLTDPARPYGAYAPRDADGHWLPATAERTGRPA